MKSILFPFLCSLTIPTKKMYGLEIKRQPGVHGQKKVFSLAFGDGCDGRANCHNQARLIWQDQIRTCMTLCNGWKCMCHGKNITLLSITGGNGGIEVFVNIEPVI